MICVGVVAVCSSLSGINLEGNTSGQEKKKACRSRSKYVVGGNIKTLFSAPYRLSTCRL